MKKILISVSDETLKELDRIATISREFIGDSPNRSRAVRIAASGWLSVYDRTIKTERK